MNNINNIAAQEFQKVHGIIALHRSRALQTVNIENLLTAWEVGAYVSERLKNSIIQSLTEQIVPPMAAQSLIYKNITLTNCFK
ncbi:hypothetical protein FACS1894181_06910 [Bacteroidia bacterium]|nr:hypothetical protein FACS1894181_06910 [Bacteroidia bacterium]